MLTFQKFLNNDSFQQLFVGNPMPIHAVRAASAGLRFYVEVTLLPENTTLYMEGVFVGNECILDISEYLRAYVSLHVAEVEAVATHYAPEGKKRFTLGYGVKDADGLLIESVANTGDVYEAFLGMMYIEKWQGFNNVLPMLSYQPESKKCSLLQLRYEYLYGSARADILTVEVTAYHYEGPNTLIVSLVDTTDTENRTTIVPLWGLIGALDLNNVWRVALRLSDPSASTSKTIVYDIDRTLRRQERLFMFQNSLGGMDTVAFTGEQTHQTEVERKIANQNLDYRYTRKTARKVALLTDFEESFTLETGYKTRTELAYLGREFLASPAIYELVNEGSTQYAMRAIVLETKKWAYDQNSTQPQSVSLAYSYAL